MSEISSLFLLLLYRYKQTLEVTSPEAFMVLSLDHLDEESWSVLNGLGEDLEEIALFIVVDQDFVLLENIDILGDLEIHILQILPNVVIVGIRNVEEFNSPSSHILDCWDDCWGIKSYMLHTSIFIVVHKLLNLRFSLSIGRLIDGNLDIFIIVSHDNRPEGRVLGVNHRVINRPESVESKSIFVILYDWFHFKISLIANNVINFCEINVRQNIVQHFFQMMDLVARKEGTGVVDVLNESVSCVTESLDGGHHDCSIFVIHLGRRVKGDSSISNSMLVEGLAVLHEKADVFDTIAMINKVLVHLLRTVLVVN